MLAFGFFGLEFGFPGAAGDEPARAGLVVVQICHGPGRGVDLLDRKTAWAIYVAKHSGSRCRAWRVPTLPPYLEIDLREATKPDRSAHGRDYQQPSRCIQDDQQSIDDDLRWKNP
jgi:hypothetical protein